MLTVRLLGSPVIVRQTEVLTISRRRSRALLFYLAAQPEPVARERLLALFWPDHERSAALQLLRTTLHGIRRDGVELSSDDGRIGLPADAWVDLHRLHQLVADLGAPLPADEVLDLWRGELLEGVELADHLGFDEWLTGEREQAHQMMVRLLLRLVGQAEAAGRPADALTAALRASEIAPLNEEAQRHVMRLRYLRGDRAGAIRRYEQLVRLLDDQLGLPPLPETRALYDDLITERLSPTANPAPAPAPAPMPAPVPAPRDPARAELPFVGRQADLQRVRAAFAQGQLVLIEGEAGIGKTRLAEEMLSRQGGLLLVGAAHQLEQALPYQPIIAALRSLLARPEWPHLRAGLGLAPLWLREVSRLVPELSPEQPPLAAEADESRLWEGLSQFLIALARQQPVSLLLDDAHWAGAASLGLIGYLARRPLSLPLSLILTARPARPHDPLETLAQSLERAQRLTRLRLNRLELSEVDALTRTMAPAAPPEVANWLHQQSEGIPYILGELLRHLRQPDGQIAPPQHEEGPIVPPTVYSLVQSRLMPLSAAARRLLDTAVAIGREMSYPLLFQAAELPDEQALDALDELTTARLLRPIGGLEYAFDHTLTMEVIYREGGEARHRAAHRRVAAAFEVLHVADLDRVSPLIATHYAEGIAIAQAAAYAERAARQARRLAAWEESLRFLEMALPAAGGERRFELLLEISAVQSHTGDVDAAIARINEALLLTTDPDRRARARLALGQIALSRSDFAAGIAIGRELAGSNDPARRADGLFLWGTTLSVEGADLIAAAERLQAAEALFAASGIAGPARLAQLRFELGSIAAQQGDLPTAIARYREALALAEGGDEPLDQWRMLAHNNLAYHLHLLADPSAEAHAQAAFQIANERGMVSLMPYIRSTLGELALARNDLVAAETHFRRGLEVAERVALRERIAGLNANLGLLAQRRGERAAAIALLRTARDLADQIGTRHLAAQIRIWLADLLEPAAARAELAAAHALAERDGRQRLLAEIAARRSALA